MGLEKSVLNTAEVHKLLKDKYGITNVQDIKHIDNSSANCYHIKDSDNEYFFKEMQSKYSLEKVEQEYKINEFLRKRNIPNSEFYQTLNGEHIWEYKNHIFHLQPYIKGKTYKINTAPRWMIKESAVYLGKIHNELKDYPKLEDRFGESAFSERKISIAAEMFQNLIEKSRNIKDESRRLKIIEDLKYRLSLLPKLSNIKFDYGNLTVSNSHGDYSVLQIICGENKIKSIIDFTDSCSLPLCWEIIRSYIFADPKCKDGLKIDIDNFKEYLKLYLDQNSLSSYDIKMMPYLYYFHLARSTFGYKQYILSPEDTSEELLQFAFWRTNMCRWLDENVEFLSKELQEI